MAAKLIWERRSAHQPRVREAYGRRRAFGGGLSPYCRTPSSNVLEVWLVMHEDLKATRKAHLLFDHLASP
jgi:hypothetical protein